MIIGITGYGYTGASAYIDVLKEFKDVQSLPQNTEFQIVQQSDGVIDLEYGLVFAKRRLHTNTTIKRFINSLNSNRNKNMDIISNGAYSKLFKEYIKILTQISWYGKSNYDPEDIKSFLSKHKKWIVNRAIAYIIRYFDKHAVWPPRQKRYFSYMEKEDFERITKQYFKKLLESFGFDLQKNIILEQVFNPFEPLSGAQFFDLPVVSIVVDRDPRDIFLLTNILYPENCGFMPCNCNVEDFVTYYKKLHSHLVDDKRVLYLRFEDLIYNYDETIGKLEKLLNSKNTNKGSIFKPELSINNTQMYLKYPQFEKEYKYIEENLNNYLYDFELAKSNVKFDVVKVNPF